MVNLISTMIFPLFSHEQRMDSRNNWQNMGNLGHCWTPSVQKLCTMPFHICSLKFGIWTRQLQLLRQTNQFVSCLVYYPTTSKFNDQQKTLSDPLQSPWQTVWTQYFDDIKSHRDAIDVLHQKNQCQQFGAMELDNFDWPLQAGQHIFFSKQIVMISVFVRIGVLVWTMLTGPFSKQPLLVGFCEPQWMEFQLVSEPRICGWICCEGQATVFCQRFWSFTVQHPNNQILKDLMKPMHVYFGQEHCDLFCVVWFWEPRRFLVADKSRGFSSLARLSKCV